MQLAEGTVELMMLWHMHRADVSAVALLSLLIVSMLQIRGSIKALFPDRDCFTLVRPMHDERALNHLDELEPDQLRPEFQEVG